MLGSKKVLQLLIVSTGCSRGRESAAILFCFLVYIALCLDILSYISSFGASGRPSQKHTYIILTLLNPTFI